MNLLGTRDITIFLNVGKYMSIDRGWNPSSPEKYFNSLQGTGTLVATHVKRPRALDVEQPSAASFPLREKPPVPTE